MTDDACFLNHDWATTRLATRERPELARAPGATFEPRLFLPENPSRHAEFGLRTRGLFKKSWPDKPLLSIVTVALNAAAFVEQTIRSVLDQGYGNVEYIVIDGGSTDGTLDILRRYEDGLDYCVSEPDQGISDSFNKGISLATGEFVGILNADDWYEPHALETVAANAERISCFSFGACTYHKADGAPVVIGPDPDYGRKIRYIMPRLHHPTVFVRRAAYERHGLFDVNLKLAMDYEMLLRLHVNGCTGAALNEKFAHMRMQGASNTQYCQVRKEVREISRRHGASRLATSVVYWLLLLKYALHSHRRWS